MGERTGWAQVKPLEDFSDILQLQVSCVFVARLSLTGQWQENSGEQLYPNLSPSTQCVLGRKKPPETKNILLQPHLSTPEYTCSAAPAAGDNLCQCQTPGMWSSRDWETWTCCAKRDHNDCHGSTATDWEGECCCLHFTQSGLRYRNMSGVLSLIKDVIIHGNSCWSKF